MLHPINFDRLAYELLPPVHRQTGWRAWLRVLMGDVSSARSSLRRLYDEFIVFRADALERASTTGQIISMEIRLNSKFVGAWLPEGPNPITFSDQNPLSGTALYSRAEAQPRRLYSRAEARPVPVYSRAELAFQQTQLTITCPLSLQSRRSEILAEVSLYIPAGVNYSIRFI
jgi:hypothetical protein